MSPPPVFAADAPAAQARAHRAFVAARFKTALVAVSALAAIAVCAIGYGAMGTGGIDGQHAAVRANLSNRRPSIHRADEFNHGTLRQIGDAAGLDAIAFETDPPPDSRESEPVLNADGRIIGFVTWPRRQEVSHAGLWLPVPAGGVLGLAAFAGFLFMRRRAARRAVRGKAGSPAQPEPGADRPAVTPVSEHLDDFVRRELPLALAADALAVHYQPIMSSDGARIVGVEALLRWNDKERGAIPPATFIPVAERHGLMDEVGAFVLRRALTETRGWPELFVAVNLSPVQMRDPTVIATVRDALAEAGVPASRLMLEITEGVLIDDPDTMVERIGELRALGVRIALDDFGSGYSNLGYLLRFPIDKIKIDRSFVTPLGRASNGGVIVQAIVGLGRALGATVLAEGVETEEQRVLLRLAGCEELQGFLFARPAPAEAIERLLSQHRPRGQTGAARALTA